MITTVTEKDHITIPAIFASQLDIKLGSKIDWSITEDENILIARILPTRGQLAREVAGMGRDWFAPGTDPVGEMLADRDREDEEEGLIGVST